VESARFVVEMLSWVPSAFGSYGVLRLRSAGASLRSGWQGWRRTDSGGKDWENVPEALEFRSGRFSVLKS